MALDPATAKNNLVVAYRKLGTLQDSGTAPTSTAVRRAEGVVNKALADFYESLYTTIVEEHRPPVTP